MFRTTVSRTLPAARTLHPSLYVVASRGPSYVLAQRAFTTGTPLFNSLTTKPTNEKASVGVEGLHKRDKTAEDSVTKENGTSDVPSVIKGDWVLFHPVYKPDELRSVEVLHREAKTFSDKIAYSFVRLLRLGFDVVSGYKHKPLPPNYKEMSIAELRKAGYIMDEHQWLRRFIFLESIAGVPGMVAATLRHLRSLRLMRRDSGWIHTLLEEAENERMHLMTFMTMRRPGYLFRAMLIGAQGIFYNIFFGCYMVSPRTCHRFVGHLEEEAVITYTKCIEEIESGHLPEWADYPAPEIAKNYWRLDDSATLLDVIYAVRSDESTHRFVNHTLSNLKKSDINPFAFREPDMTVKGKRIAFTRDEAERYVQESHKLIEDGKFHPRQS
ncbi:AOX, alternative oxidase mitochondrial precursor [Laetiporus sulphureus 93-53]|uniref:Alternative oxidase n=1 Tax=Laetiporus sulphureus 93-53 TaxID=1314785 RepID=A0A165HQW0_9APHY|nr:AOX, alternative oxidase mitochondrial precursor [Laetiporus sulphureus 93-53]KZT12063.1 AOX, alternative oxidase mitochondrial precursor [Laetiporus sulphureus 93-53]